MKRSIFLGFVIWILVFGLLGCTKEDPNPELNDPIYKDLLGRQKDNSTNYKSELAKQAALEKKIAADAPNTIDLASDRRDLSKSLHVAIKYKQMALYYKIRAQRRKLVDHITYHEAFVEKKPWPDRKEYSEYLVNMHLQEAPRDWGAGVPKLNDRIANFQRKFASTAPAKKKK